MRALTVDEMNTAMGGRLLGDVVVPSAIDIAIDSRKDVTGRIFFAIRGENHDGHLFVNDVLARGAAAAVVSDLSHVDPAHHFSGRVIQVVDVVAALGRLAAWYRKQFAAQVIAVVGSNGKTTTKDIIAAVLGHTKRGKFAHASFNNQIGVPLTILSVEPADEFVVVEIGTNHPGEVAALGRIVQPDIAVVTSIGEEHLEFFETLEGVASEEFSIVSSLRGRAFLVMSHQAAEYAPDNLAGKCSTLKYGFEEKADLRAMDVVADARGQAFKVNGRFDFRLPLLGRHNVVNSLAAIAIGMRFRLTPEQIAQGLLKVHPAKMRLEAMSVGAISVINDAYNANPSSMRAAFEVMDQLDGAGRKVLILGDMRELGGQTERCHREVGKEAGRSRAKVIIAVGAFARYYSDGVISIAGTSKRIHTYPKVEAAAEKIAALLEPGDTVLLKGSRGMGLERLIPAMNRRGAAAMA
jgi:UDP-N-acetylmuramoyl-tripeptide--D-alanyl-D-alanine ligase